MSKKHLEDYGFSVPTFVEPKVELKKTRQTTLDNAFLTNVGIGLIASHSITDPDIIESKLRVVVRYLLEEKKKVNVIHVGSSPTALEAASRIKGVHVNPPVGKNSFEKNLSALEGKNGLVAIWDGVSIGVVNGMRRAKKQNIRIFHFKIK